MKLISFYCLLLLCHISVMAASTDSLLNKAMPILAGKTLDGQTIDAGYYRGHITLVNFMYIGCPPCMNEIGIINKLKAEYAGNPRFQILCIPRQMGSQMKEFNADGKVMFAQLRKALGIEPIQYTILPGCAEHESKMIKDGDEVKLGSECNTVAEIFNVSGFPTNFFVDDNGIIRKIEKGGPAKKNDPDFHDTLKKDIDSLLSRK